MANQNGKGPNENGPRTGRGLGKCKPSEENNSNNGQRNGRGVGRGQGRQRS